MDKYRALAAGLLAVALLPLKGHQREETPVPVVRTDFSDIPKDTAGQKKRTFFEEADALVSAVAQKAIENKFTLLFNILSLKIEVTNDPPKLAVSNGRKILVDGTEIEGAPAFSAILDAYARLPEEALPSEEEIKRRTRQMVEKAAGESFSLIPEALLEEGLNNLAEALSRHRHIYQEKSSTRRQPEEEEPPHTRPAFLEDALDKERQSAPQKDAIQR